MHSEWAACRCPGRISHEDWKGQGRPTPDPVPGPPPTSRRRRGPNALNSRPDRHRQAQDAPAGTGRPEGPTQRLPGPRRQPRPTYLQRLLLRPRPERPPWWSPGPAFSRPPSLWRADGAGAGQGGRGAARAGARERAEARPARRGSQRPSPPQEENNTTATWPRRGARREEGGRKSRLAAGGGPGPGSPSARDCTAARAKGAGFRRARNARIPAGGMGTAVSQTGG